MDQKVNLTRRKMFENETFILIQLSKLKNQLEKSKKKLKNFDKMKKWCSEVKCPKHYGKSCEDLAGVLSRPD